MSKRDIDSCQSAAGLTAIRQTYPKINQEILARMVTPEGRLAGALYFHLCYEDATHGVSYDISTQPEGNTLAMDTAAVVVEHIRRKLAAGGVAPTDQQLLAVLVKMLATSWHEHDPARDHATTLISEAVRYALPDLYFIGAVLRTDQASGRFSVAITTAAHATRQQLH